MYDNGNNVSSRLVDGKLSFTSKSHITNSSTVEVTTYVSLDELVEEKSSGVISQSGDKKVITYGNASIIDVRYNSVPASDTTGHLPANVSIIQYKHTAWQSDNAVISAETGVLDIATTCTKRFYTNSTDGSIVMSTGSFKFNNANTVTSLKIANVSVYALSNSKRSNTFNTTIAQQGAGIIVTYSNPVITTFKYDIAEPTANATTWPTVVVKQDWSTNEPSNGTYTYTFDSGHTDVEGLGVNFVFMNSSTDVSINADGMVTFLKANNSSTSIKEIPVRVTATVNGKSAQQ